MLDLFAGSGALGLEALSRGAAYCLFVDDDADARGAIRENIEALRLTGASKVWRRDAAKLGPASPMQPFQLLFVDPPYGQGLGELSAWRRGGWRLAFARRRLRSGGACGCRRHSSRGFRARRQARLWRYGASLPAED